MIRKKVINPNRIRKINGGFSFIPHNFIRHGFLAMLNQEELLLYFFLVLVSDRHGLSYYAYDSICSLLQISLDQYIEARNNLIDKDLIAFDGTLFQVLSLPDGPMLNSTKPLGNQDETTSGDSVVIQQLIRKSLGKNYLSYKDGHDETGR